MGVGCLHTHGRTCDGRSVVDDSGPGTSSVPATVGGRQRRLRRPRAVRRRAADRRRNGAAAARTSPCLQPHLRRAVRRRSPEPHRVPARRPRRRHGVPGRHRRVLARLAAPPARRLQQPADVRRARREGASRARAGAGSTGARVEAVRRPGHRQRRRRHLLRPAAPRQRHVPGPLPVRDGGDARSTTPARGHADRLEPVRAERSRWLEPARRRSRVSDRQPRPDPARRRLLVPRPQLHGRPRRPQAVRALDGGFELWGGAGQGQAVGGGQLRGRRRRAGDDRRPRLVPRRLVGSADADVEGGDRCRDRRASAGDRGAAGAGRIAVRAGDARARRIAHDPREARLVRAAEPPAQRQGSGRGPPRSGQGPFPGLVRRALSQPGCAASRTGAPSTTPCARGRCASASACTTRRCRRR